jgi:spore maturation protein CgeB
MKIVFAFDAYNQTARMIGGLLEREKPASYRAACQLVADNFPDWYHLLGEELRAVYGWDVEFFIPNARALNDIWRAENPSGAELHGESLLLHQIQKAKPDALYAYLCSSGREWRDFLPRVRAAVPSLKVIAGQDGVGRCDLEMQRGVDVVFSCLRHIADYYQQNWSGGVYFPYAYSTKLDELTAGLPTTQVAHSLGFVGSLFSFNEADHSTRKTLLLALGRKYPLKVWTSSVAAGRPYLRKSQIYRFLAGDWQGLADAALLHKMCQGEACGIEMFALLRRTSISINAHIATAKGFAANMRLFEATGAGSCLVTESASNLGDFFEPDYEVVSYKSIDECVEKVGWLLAHPDEQAAIAERGRKRVLQQHLYKHRVSLFAEAIRARM